MTDPVALPALPPEEAIAYFKAKGLALSPSFHWQDFWQEDHAAAFTVAKSAGFDILGDIHQAILDGLENGTTFETFKTQLVPILQAKGWWGRQAVVDPANPEAGPQLVQLGSIRRLRTIWDTNMRTSWAAGRWNQILRTAGSRPYLRYSAVMDARTRPLHRIWHGTILPIDHPWWETHFPPCGWNCRCTVQTVGHLDLDRYDWTVSDAPPEDGPPVRFVNKRTGDVSLVPVGVDPGFGYNPGQAAVDTHAARVAAAKWVDADPKITAAQQAASIAFMRPLLTQDFAAWTDRLAQALDAGDVKPIGEQRVVGALSQPVLDYLGGQGIDVASGAVTITDRQLLHAIRDAKASPVLLADLRNLPDIIMSPEKILFDRKDPALLYTFDAGSKVGKLVVRVNFKEKIRDAGGAKGVSISNAVTTATLIQPSNLNGTLADGTPWYVEIGEKPQPPGGTPPSS